MREAEKIVNAHEMNIKINLSRYKNGLITKEQFIKALKKNISIKTQCPHCKKIFTVRMED